MGMQLCENPKEASDGSRIVRTAPLRLAMLGMIPGNGHPFSWSAIINGYDAAHLEACPYPGILDYMSHHPDAKVPTAAVTHVWTDKPAEALPVAQYARIPHVVAKPEDVIGQVDAVIIATDDGDDHVERARPFIEAGLPILVDKPMATNADDLRTFVKWRNEGARILSSSGLRYAVELSEFKNFSWEWLTAVTCNTWKRYGIHILEPVYTLTGPGFTSVRSHTEGVNQFVHLHHSSGQNVTLTVLQDTKGAFGAFQACGATGTKTFQFKDTYSAFRGQLVAFVDYVLSGEDPYPFSETVELMTIILAATESSQRGGAAIDLKEFHKNLAL